MVEASMFGKSTFQEDLNELSMMLTNSPTKTDDNVIQGQSAAIQLIPNGIIKSWMNIINIVSICCIDYQLMV
jgi:hypothetical protein